MKSAKLAGAVAGNIYNPTGESTPPRREYSQAESLVKRGLYAEAADAYELHTAEFPDDPEPCLRLARLYRDAIGRYDEAVTWMERAGQTGGLTSGQELMIIQELVELYTQKLRQPRKAITELALLIHRFPDAPPAANARRELAAMRELLAKEQQDQGSFEELFYAMNPQPPVDTATD